ncbi:MAG: type II secretion system protein [Gammaproteobacteria bacterium]|nr:type II secretion system protein [Gammaproteobacteria bacterium]
MKQRQSGFSYMELLVATLLIAIMLVPALDAMQSGIQGSGIHTQLAQNQYRMISKMEQTLALPFSELLQQADLVADPTVLIPSPYSDSAGTEFRRLVYLARYDGDNADGNDNPFNGTDAGLLWLRVTIENSQRSLETVIVE